MCFVTFIADEVCILIGGLIVPCHPAAHIRFCPGMEHTAVENMRHGGIGYSNLCSRPRA